MYMKKKITEHHQLSKFFHNIITNVLIDCHLSELTWHLAAKQIIKHNPIEKLRSE